MQFPDYPSCVVVVTDKSLFIVMLRCEGPVAQRIRHLTTNQGIPGSNPGRVDFFAFFFL